MNFNKNSQSAKIVEINLSRVCTLRRARNSYNNNSLVSLVANTCVNFLLYFIKHFFGFNWNRIFAHLTSRTRKWFYFIIFLKKVEKSSRKQQVTLIHLSNWANGKKIKVDITSTSFKRICEKFIPTFFLLYFYFR